MDDRPGRTGAPRQAAVGQAQPASFREAMSRVAETVHVVTTDGPAGKAGLTATAFAAVSDAPPTVIVCVKATSRFLPRLDRNAVFCVNTLAETDRAVAEIFAGRTGRMGVERFDEALWTECETGAPLLKSALVAFDCRLAEARRVATHVVLLGEVVALHFGARAPALVYHDRGYHSF